MTSFFINWGGKKRRRKEKEKIDERKCKESSRKGREWQERWTERSPLITKMRKREEKKRKNKKETDEREYKELLGKRTGKERITDRMISLNY